MSILMRRCTKPPCDTPREPDAAGIAAGGGILLDDDWQPFPMKGSLARNMNLAKAALKAKIAGNPGEVYAYVMTSVSMDETPGGSRVFRQFGSAPNFQGGCLTLCTCKHQMRAGLRDVRHWRDKWVAGFTSMGCERTWLFYLARVKDGFESHFDLWTELGVEARNAKSAASRRHGDVFEPRGSAPGVDHHNPASYHPPVAGHVHGQHGLWRHDIAAVYYGRTPALLLARPELTFVWAEPRLYLDGHPRTRKWGSVAGLVNSLKANKT